MIRAIGGYGLNIQPTAGTPAAETPRALSHAVAPIQPYRTPSDRAAPRRPDVGFLTHLIATAAKAPQTCERRRLAAHEAANLYAASRQANLAETCTLLRSI